MSDVNVLYLVTGIVLAALAVWAGIVLVTAPDAPDESPVDAPPLREKGPEAPEPRSTSSYDDPTMVTRRPLSLDETPPPSTVEVAVRSERKVAIGGKTAPVVILPVMRARLDSHTEIRDDGSSGAPAAGPAGAAAKPATTDAAGAPAPASALDSVPPPSGPPLSLVSAIGRSDPAAGPTERSAIVDRHRLFILADGAGQRVQNELVSAVVVDALAAAFEANSEAAFPADPSLPRRADRLRRAVLTAEATLKERAKGEPVDTSKVGVLAAHFTPDNRHLYIATSGTDRAYRMRAQEVVQLNRSGLRPSLPPGVTAGRVVDTIAVETTPDDVYVFGSDAAFLALGDELRAVLTFDPSVDRVAAHFVAAATRDGTKTGMTAIVVRVDPPRASQRPTTI